MTKVFMKTKTIKMLLATVVAAIAVNAFFIVSNSNAGMNLLKGNVEALTDPGAGLPQGPHGDSYASDYHCKMTMQINVTLKATGTGTDKVELSAGAGGTGIINKVIDIQGSVDYSHSGSHGDETSVVFSGNFTDENDYPGRKCDERNSNSCSIWHPCGYYHAEAVKNYVYYMTGYYFWD